jgi:cephalosporin hydroxylase
MRYYPAEFIENVPVWLNIAQNAPTSAEMEQAQNIRSAFLFPNDPCPYMVDIVRAFRLLKGKQTYIEIGTYDKGNLAYASTLLALGAHIIDIDIAAYPEATQHLQQILQPSQRLTTIVGNSRSPETVTKVRTALDVELVDAIFIDGDHVADAVMADLAT